ncbi:hypothetical protein SUGI_0155160 [Cryptomeria japonica]|uniref:chloroplast envelope membrane protein isoform X2 n=1 Tax=Cryptomeria japonica TaxID=3369 RepID=UPI002408E016|nr:chloroplast envelope membrane protein isoform X2 [Cryptomeria japonica]GLJ11385.1 hypothetical protein SUGI_0155160 [Cryptomeria japonica]
MTNSALVVGSTLHYAALLRCPIPAFHGHAVYFRRRTSFGRFTVTAHHFNKNKWWHKFLLHQLDSPTWLGLGHEEEEEEDDNDEVFRDGHMEEEETGPDARDWEDWLDDSWVTGGSNASLNEGKGWDTDEEGIPRDNSPIPERGMYSNVTELLFRLFQNPGQLDDDLTYEDKLFQFTTQTTVKFVALLVIVPWAVSFVFHDYVMVPFLNRYVELVPFAAQLLDVRKDQKLYMVEVLKQEKLRLHFEAEIHMAPLPSEEELWEHMRHKARELREDLRLDNRKSFANIWSDMVAAITAFFILLFNQSKVELLKFTGSRILKGISETGKAFLLILVTDIFLGYHSESGWHTLIEMLLEHYGLMADESAITVFICTVPVTMDVCFKLWVFKYLPRLSPSTSATFHEMKRH